MFLWVLLFTTNKSTTQLRFIHLFYCLVAIQLLREIGYAKLEIKNKVANLKIYSTLKLYLNNKLKK